MDLTKREEIASEILGQPVRHGDTMHCRFEKKHTKHNGPRDLRVCLDEGGGKVPGFYCFHGGCADDWAVLNKQLRRAIWFAEHGREDNRPRTQADVAAEPQRKREGEPFSYEALARFERADLGINDEWLAARSPVDVATCDAESYLHHVYQPGDRVIIFTVFESQGQFMFWQGNGSYRLGRYENVKAVPSKLPKGGPEGVWYLAQPVDGKWRPNTRAPALPDGSIPKSRRIMECVTAWRYMILECDHKEKACPCKDCNGRDNPRIHELWLNFLVQLPLPVVAIYTSAGKSVHALVKVPAETKEGWDRQRQLVLRLFTKCGADPRALTAVRLTRLPGCMRGSRLQKLLYLNPKPDDIGTPIIQGGGLS